MHRALLEFLSSFSGASELPESCTLTARSNHGITGRRLDVYNGMAAAGWALDPCAQQSP